jgi:hypothetical protein
VVLGDFYVEMSSEVSDSHQAGSPSNTESSYGFSVNKQTSYMRSEVFKAMEIIVLWVTTYNTVKPCFKVCLWGKLGIS